MILSDIDIKKAVAERKIILQPYFEECIQPASIDVHLDKNFLIFKTTNQFVVDVKKPVDEMMQEVEISDDVPFILHPGEFALGMTYEKIGVADDMVGRLEGKSSLGRLGIIIHATAGYLDPGNFLKMTLELHNIGQLPVMLYYKMPIAQMSFTPLSSKAEKPYGAAGLNSKYYGAEKPQASQFWKNFGKNKGPLASTPNSK
ncbi:dCTP deaminase [Candidatus Uhrbacteria bacterium]|nr:dCTP deaminase [Candidatus Uhrbacteria bacterium]